MKRVKEILKQNYSVIWSIYHTVLVVELFIIIVLLSIIVL